MKRNMPSRAPRIVAGIIRFEKLVSLIKNDDNGVLKRIDKTIINDDRDRTGINKRNKILPLSIWLSVRSEYRNSELFNPRGTICETIRAYRIRIS
jgi:hypothetical protein